VRVVARAVEVGPTTLVCEVIAIHAKANGEDKIVGRGQQVQRILPKRKLESLIRRETQ
jgi:hypothetical protein